MLSLNRWHPPLSILPPETSWTFEFAFIHLPEVVVSVWLALLVSSFLLELHLPHRHDSRRQLRQSLISLMLSASPCSSSTSLIQKIQWYRKQCPWTGALRCHRWSQPGDQLFNDKKRHEHLCPALTDVCVVVDSVGKQTFLLGSIRGSFGLL